jgi:hypothetical protein
LIVVPRMVDWSAARIHAPFQMTAVRLLLLGLLAGCSRTGLGLEDGELELDAGVTEEAALDAERLPDSIAPAGCVPSEELCNGKDDDCDGEVDELPAIPCPGGGFQYCVAGALSQCPKRCETCMPGTQRICFVSYCKFWAVQTCTADGKSFGRCREQDAPPECAKIADSQQYSRALQQCCLDQGYCCRDDFDLDGDGDTGEMLGNCDELSCEP